MQHANDVGMRVCVLQMGEIKHRVGEFVNGPKAQGRLGVRYRMPRGPRSRMALNMGQGIAHSVTKTLRELQVGDIKIVVKGLLQVVSGLGEQHQARHVDCGSVAPRAASMRAVQPVRKSFQLRASGPESNPSCISALKGSCAARSSSRRTKSRTYSLAEL